MYRPNLTILRDILEDTGFSVFQDVQTVPLSIDRIGQNMQEQTLILFHCILLYIMYYVRLQHKFSRHSVKMYYNFVPILQHILRLLWVQ